MSIEKTGANRPIQAPVELTTTRVNNPRETNFAADAQSAKRTRTDSICFNKRQPTPVLSLQEIKNDLLHSLESEKSRQAVARLSEEVKNRTYNPDANTIANAMLTGLQED